MKQQAKRVNLSRIVELSIYEPPKIVESNRENWVGWGEEDNYFDFLIERYTTSPTNNAVINNIAKLIFGKGISAVDASKKPSDYASLMNIVSEECIKQFIIDLKMLGNATWQIVWDDKHEKVLKIYHLPVQLVRAEKCNEDGDVEAYYYSDNWQDTKQFPPKRYPAFGTSTEEIEVMYVKQYSVGTKYYSYPDYQGSIPYAVLENDIAQYLINEVQNGFSGTKVINFNNGVPSEEQMDETTSSVMNKLTGPNGKRVIVSFNDTEANKTTIDDISLNDAPSHYEYLAEECMRKILLGHNVTSPLLFGISSTNGFGSNADELENSFILYYNLVIKPYQDIVLKSLSHILAENGITLKLYFKTLKPLEFSGVEQVNTELSSQANLIDSLIGLGEDVKDDWVLIDEYDVDYELEAERDEEIAILNMPKQTLMSKIRHVFFDKKVVSTGTARPNSKSDTDEWVDGFKFYTRYRYDGPVDSNSRSFCSKMVSANKLYRKEDIQMMSKLSVNPGWGPHGEDQYDIWLYKGGGNCRHVWKRQVYVALSERGNIDFNSPIAEQKLKIAVNKAEKAGYVVKNPKKVSQKPRDMAYNGFLPDNPRFGR